MGQCAQTGTMPFQLKSSLSEKQHSNGWCELLRAVCAVETTTYTHTHTYRKKRSVIIDLPHAGYALSLVHPLAATPQPLPPVTTTLAATPSGPPGLPSWLQGNWGREKFTGALRTWSRRVGIRPPAAASRVRPITVPEYYPCRTSREHGLRRCKVEEARNRVVGWR
ncbi:unnamed protein product [Periconia digitata]|uniref:Uncharacterized protein n=1 Tax=Periconia digitata TaxID=1303443 RepID=A0A9W4XD96_9PLEO|nr:unnamed protein product [Periconia digitata]